MWFLVRLGISAAAFIFRLVIANRKALPIGAKVQDVDSQKVYVSTQSNKNSIHTTKFHTPLKSRSLFKLTKEAEIDRFFKKLGLARETQTGDKKFDDKVYVASDSPAFAKEISQDTKVRELILELLLSPGGHSIVGDGHHLCARFSGNRSKSPDLSKKLVALSKQLHDIDNHAPHFLRDPYVWRAFFVEALVWSVATFAALGFFDWMTESRDLHLNSWSIVLPGLGLGLGAAAVLFFVSLVLLGGSSRAHRVLVESAVVLLGSLPVGGIHLVSDLNTELDKSDAIFSERAIVNKEMRRHRRRRSTYYTYHFYVGPALAPEPIRLKTHYQVNSTIYSNCNVGHNLRLELREGYLGFPWIKNMGCSRSAPKS